MKRQVSMNRLIPRILVTSVGLLGAFACSGSAEGDPANTTGETPAPPQNTVPETPNQPVTPGTNPETPVSPTTTPVTPVTPVPVPTTGPQITACEDSTVGAPVLRALTKSEFENSIDDIFPGIAGKWSNSLPSNSVSAAGFDNDASAVIGEQTAEQLLATAESVGDAVSASLSTLLPCSSNADHACAAEFLDTFGKRLFRRSLTEAENTQFLAFFDMALADTDFPKAMKWLTAALVQSPKAVYRSELGTTAGAGRNLSQTEVATLLAYAFTGSTPSKELVEQAEAGQLNDPVAVAKSLLQTDAGKQTLHRFFEAYTDYVRAGSKAKPAAQANGINYNDVSADMVKETRAFLDAMLFTEGASWQEVLTSTTTYPSQKLATFYGMSAPGSDYGPVERAAGHGVGLTAQASFLAAHANSDASSPTQRGLFAYINMLCRTKPPLPDNVPQLGEAQTGVQTTRQRYELAHAQGECAGCHKLFDPIGFGFEHFDEAGNYRADEEGLPIDPTGELTTFTGETLSFDGQEALMNGLASLPEVHQCFAAYLATYAFGTNQSCLATHSVPEMQAGSMSVVDAFASLASEPHFTTRSAQ